MRKQTVSREPSRIQDNQSIKCKATCTAKKESWVERGQPESGQSGPYNGMKESDYTQICSLCTVSPLYTNLPVANVPLVSGRNQDLRHQLQEWVNCSLPFCLLLLTSFKLYHLPPPLPPPDSSSCCLFTSCQPPACRLYHCITVLSKIYYCKSKNVYFFLLFYVLFV